MEKDGYVEYLLSKALHISEIKPKSRFFMPEGLDVPIGFSMRNVKGEVHVRVLSPMEVDCTSVVSALNKLKTYGKPIVLYVCSSDEKILNCSSYAGFVFWKKKGKDILMRYIPSSKVLIVD